MLIFERDNWPRHRPWIAFCAIATIAAIGWYGFVWRGSTARPGGSSLPGFTFGVIGGAICLFEFLLWPRKKLRIWRLGRVQGWLRAHIWLGLLSLPILVLHSGFYLGGSWWSLSTVLMLLFLAVIASGVWGLVMQQSLPTKMLYDVPSETIFSQIGRVRKQFHAEAERLVLATCGPPEGTEPSADVTDQSMMTSTATMTAPHMVIGAVRRVGRVQGKVLQSVAATVQVPESEPLRAFFADTVGPYLVTEEPHRSPLGRPRRAEVMFQDIKTKLRPAAHPAVDMLLSFCQQRRELDEQARIHRWLHNWLCIHLPLSVALIVLMFAHIFYALMYV